VRVVLAKLPPEQKKKAWAAIQRDAPSLAEFMQSETYALFRDKLGASVVIDVEDGKVIEKREVEDDGL